jgi:predicted PurR-regulated permease PerM
MARRNGASAVTVIEDLEKQLKEKLTDLTQINAEISNPQNEFQYQKLHKKQSKDVIKEIRDLEVAVHTLKYGKVSVVWSKVTIVVAVAIALLVTFLFESFKPEITDWIRHLLGLASLPR